MLPSPSRAHFSEVMDRKGKIPELNAPCAHCGIASGLQIRYIYYNQLYVWKTHRESPNPSINIYNDQF